MTQIGSSRSSRSTTPSRTTWIRNTALYSDPFAKPPVFGNGTSESGSTDLLRVLAVLSSLITFAIQFVPTLIMQELVKDLQSTDSSDKLCMLLFFGPSLLAESQKWIYAVILLVAPIISSFFHNYGSLTLAKIGTPFCSL